MLNRKHEKNLLYLTTLIKVLVDALLLVKFSTIELFLDPSYLFRMFLDKTMMNQYRSSTPERRLKPRQSPSKPPIWEKNPTQVRLGYLSSKYTEI